MKILGIESSCDECAASIVEDGRHILSSVVLTQIPFHERYQGVVPEIASRKHTEWIEGIVRQALADAGLRADQVDGIAATSRPGLVGALLVGFTFAKAMAWALERPFIAVNHMLAHLYAAHLDPAGYPSAQGSPSSTVQKPRDAGFEPPEYPYLGLLASGGHSMICRVEDFDRMEVLGTTIDDAAGEAFDKVAKHYGFGYPGGLAIDRLAEQGDERAFAFPLPVLAKGQRPCDLSYSGLKTAAIHHLERYRRPGAELSPQNIAASFRRAAIDTLISRLERALEMTGLTRIVAGGGVAANSYLRRSLAARPGIQAIFPPLALCGDNGAMVAGVGYRHLIRGERSPLTEGVSSRVPLYRSLQRPT